MNRFARTINILRKLHKTNIGMPPPIFKHRLMYITPSSGHELMNLDLPFKLILRRFEVVSDIWSENAALSERLIEIHSNPPILYYGFKGEASPSIYADWVNGG